MRFLITTFIICCLMTACDKFEFNVYETNGGEKDITVTTQYNIERLLHLPEKDSLHIIFTGDTQRQYDDLEDMVEAINALPQVDAVVVAGDISDFGAEFEFELINKQLKLLKVPFITVIGNHDCLANGVKVYEEVYGPLNYSFTWNRIRFVVHNTNSREFNFNGSVPDIAWMQQQLADKENYQSCIFVSHVPPYSEDFDPSLVQAYTQLIHNAKNPVLSTNGHRHNYSLDQPFDDGVWYLNTSSPSNRMFSHVVVTPNSRYEKKFTSTPVAY